MWSMCGSPRSGVRQIYSDTERKSMEQTEHSSEYITTYQLEIENRLKNMVWTICGDYTVTARPDIVLYRKAPDIALYDAIKQGAGARYFDQEALSLYLIKKIYLGADETKLLYLSQLCMEVAVSPKIAADRPGSVSVRKRAYQAILAADEAQMAMHRMGRAKLIWIQHILGTYRMQSAKGEQDLELLEDISGITETDELIARIDELYNQWLDPSFLREHGTLQDVLAVTIEEMQDFDWKDFLSEEMIEENLEDLLERMSREMMATHHPEEKEEKKEATAQEKKITYVTEEDFAKVYSYIEKNFGRTYMTPLEEKKKNYQYCKGVHADCGVYYTKGILASPVLRNYQYMYAGREKRRNEDYLKQHFTMVRQNIQTLTDLLKKTMVLKNEVNYLPSDSGTLVASKLWKVGRVRDPKLFIREQKERQQELVVEILIDASGSQRVRQSQVAIQAYILTKALSNVGIAHRVTGFCTFWDYTVLQQYRDYDDPPEADSGILAFNTGSNNRDGLALRAAAGDLLAREEEKKILLFLSDGRPYDVIANRPNARNPAAYCGDYAIKDTAAEVRGLRNNGVAVLGIFAGEEEDLEAEKKIFGRDFAYIRDLNNFSKVTGRYLAKQLEE